MPPLAETVEKLSVPELNRVSGMIGSYGSTSSLSYFFKIEPQELYHELVENLMSNKLQKQFFKDNNLIKDLAIKKEDRSERIVFEQDFRQKISVSGIKKNKGEREFVTITLRGKNPEHISKWLNDFVRLADKSTIMAQTRSFSVKVKMVKENVTRRIESLRSTEQSRRLDKIARLEEAIDVADKLGWIKGNEKRTFRYEQVTAENLKLSFSLQEMPLYLRGTLALQAEIDVLRERKNDDPFIPELRSLQEQYDFLSSAKQGTGDIHAMRIDRPAVANNIPKKPKRKLIVVSGFVLGILLSVFVVFLRNMSRK